MSNKIHKIRDRLKAQQKIEGYTPETALLLKILPSVRMQSEWGALTKVKHHRYGKLSYEVHIFYYPSSLLVNIEGILLEKPIIF